MEEAYVHSPEAVIKKFGVSATQGLSEQQVASARTKYGPNGMFCSAVLSKTD